MSDVLQDARTSPRNSESRRSNPRPKKSKQINNPLQLGITRFLTTLQSEHDQDDQIKELCSFLTQTPHALPKRYNIYPPLLLLPSSFLASEKASDQHPETTRQQNPWNSLVITLSNTSCDQLWRCLNSAFQKDGITHIAIGAPIELEINDSHGGRENILRSPTGITPVYGDFGAVPSSRHRSPNVEDQTSQPSYSSTLWVQSIQNGGIIQTWAPMWTMFSRGNIKEKARILTGAPTIPSVVGSSSSTASTTPTFHGLDGPDGILSQSLSEIAVVDMYVGIGYFAFSYLKRGIGRVIGFELNPWSVEGLRRGAERNGWDCEVFTIPQIDTSLQPSDRILPEPHSTEDSTSLLTTLFNPQQLHRLQSTILNPRIKLLIFHGDNRHSLPIITYLQNFITHHPSSPPWLPIRHINLGLLPTSLPSYPLSTALLLSTSNKRGGWIHVHENVEIEGIEQKKNGIVEKIEELIEKKNEEGSGWRVECVHVERVKSFAPGGIWHCVFDIWVWKDGESGQLA